ncbi:hypothetical protein BQ8794_50528 [Mesorhizobium prunaredense]|uniref:Type II toxin-antitoxin system RelE/ParE family toxin n=1 Tax=Mesorhizobium prunaredense TaxID=1631249 RepID=A0A1R3VEU2_9HYPH|nr:type II toxin-antitoxin system RelE/ParE family toxin [Mesorhizobium prunaredense]SIT58426.1 hypothetical protein BQ8794_50528 [Mesorhizobium prunaredense]
MPRLRTLPSVQTDLVNIFEYVTRESGSLVLGRRFVDALRQKCRDLASLQATIGRARPDLRPDIRSFAFRGYVIFFRYNGDCSTWRTSSKGIATSMLYGQKAKAGRGARSS